MASVYSEIDKLLMDIRSGLDYQKYLTPVNFESENNKFTEYYKENKIYNPQYVYNKFDADAILEKYNYLVSVFSYDGTEIGEIYRKYIDILYYEILMYGNIGKEEFMKLSTKVYGEPNRRYLENALTIINRKSAESENEMLYDADKMANILRRRIECYGFKWEVIVSTDMAARVSVEPEQKKVYVNKYKKFSQNDSVRLQVHEIDTHVLRTENGYLRSILPLAFGTARFMIHEEGLALYNEAKENVQDPLTEVLYAARFITGINIQKSFFELYDMLKEYGCSDFTAMYVVSRFKRGMTDTSCGGGFIKDYLYFQGLHDVKNAIDNDNSIYNKMYYGSIGLDDIQALKKSITKAMDEEKIILPLNGGYIS